MTFLAVKWVGCYKLKCAVINILCLLNGKEGYKQFNTTQSPFITAEHTIKLHFLDLILCRWAYIFKELKRELDCFSSRFFKVGYPYGPPPQRVTFSIFQLPNFVEI